MIHFGCKYRYLLEHQPIPTSFHWVQHFCFPELFCLFFSPVFFLFRYFVLSLPLLLRYLHLIRLLCVAGLLYAACSDYVYLLVPVRLPRCLCLWLFASLLLLLLLYLGFLACSVRSFCVCLHWFREKRPIFREFEIIYVL